MAEPTDTALARARNGVSAPLYFDRQVVRAEDLTLDRQSHSAELARMRRFLHGWGVVAGLIPGIEADTLTLGPGYGVTPTGQEVFLDGTISVTGIAGRVRACCGPQAPGCDRLEEDAQTGDAAAPVLSWLVARPTATPADPRPGVAEGCAHPANALRFSRSCAGVALELLCAYPDSHRVEQGPPGHLCGGFDPNSPDMDMMLPMPGPVPEAEDVVILGQIRVEDGVAHFRTADRRALLPTALLQEWLRTTTCRQVYYVNINPQTDQDNEHEVHRLGCPGFVPAEANRLYLGWFQNGEDALRAARRHFDEVDGCANCMPRLDRR